MKKIITALYDEKNLTGEYFYHAFNQRDGMQAVFHASNENDLLEKLRHIVPEVLFMHVRPDRKEHRQLIQKLKKEFPSVRLLVMLINYEPTPSEVFNLISAGAKGIITDSYCDKDVMQAAEEIISYGIHCNSVCTRQLFEIESRKNLLTNSHQSSLFFSERESRIINLKREGRTSGEVGEILHISDRTVDNILMKLYERFNCHSILELISQYDQLRIEIVN